MVLVLLMLVLGLRVGVGFKFSCVVEFVVGVSVSVYFGIKMRVVV